MITPFNRRELITTFSMDTQAKVRDILSQNSIDYQIKTSNHSSGMYTRGRTGSFGQSSNYAYQYTIFVRRQDYENALYLINK